MKSLAGAVIMAAGLLVSTAAAWDSPGHMAVAAIACARLDPEVRVTVERFAQELRGPQGGYDAVTMACWMDDLREADPSIPYHRQFLTWHYINFSVDPNGIRPSTEPGPDDLERGNAVVGFKRAMAVLTGGDDPWIKSRAVACAIVMHLVGDIHQPLHAASRYFTDPTGAVQNDAGGNKVAIVNGPVEELKYNLHYFWDAAYRGNYDASSERLLIDYRFGMWNEHDHERAKPLIDQFLSIQGEVDDGGSFEDWANESNRLAAEKVYSGLAWITPGESARLTAEYVGTARELVRARMVIAGHRLAKVLNGALRAHDR
jgi:nuclease S1